MAIKPHAVNSIASMFPRQRANEKTKKKVVGQSVSTYLPTIYVRLSVPPCLPSHELVAYLCSMSPRVFALIIDRHICMCIKN